MGEFVSGKTTSYFLSSQNFTVYKTFSLFPPPPFADGTAQSFGAAATAR
jgi:hypothetical protein